MIISAKKYILLTSIEIALEQDLYLTLVTAHGIIRGKLDDEMLDIFENGREGFEKEYNLDVECVTHLSVIVLKNVSILVSSDASSKINCNKLTVFPEHIIAIAVEQAP